MSSNNLWLCHLKSQKEFASLPVSEFFVDDDDGDVKCTYAEAAEPPRPDTFIFLFSFLFFPFSHCNQI